jgi:hypothetical protein
MVTGDAMFQALFQVFHLDIAKVDLGCCICCNDIIRMLQAYVSTVLDVSEVCFMCVYMYVAYVAMPIHACFGRMFQVFHLFQTYDSNVSS